MNTKPLVMEPESTVRTWNVLMPGGSPQEADVYSSLSEEELRQLACLARIHWLIETGRDAPNGVSAKEALRIEQYFSERGWDAKWLLAQRDEVRERRVQQSFNAEVDGRPAALSGLVLPLDWRSNGGFTRFLLTPELGACSHEPPPPHHQVVYVESPAPIDLGPEEIAENGGELRLSVNGAIHFDASSHHAFLVDGMMRVDASYIIDSVSIKFGNAVL